MWTRWYVTYVKGRSNLNLMGLQATRAHRGLLPPAVIVFLPSYSWDIIWHRGRVGMRLVFMHYESLTASEQRH